MDLVQMGYQTAKDIPELQYTLFNIPSSLGRLTFAARMEKKLTQNQLAELANVSPKTIHRIEGGRGGVTDKTYEKVLSVLGVNNDDIAAAFKVQQV